MTRQEVYIQREPDIADKGLNLWQKWNTFTMAVGVGTAGVGMFLGIPLLVGAGAVGVGVDAAQIYGVNKIKSWREKRRQENAIREQVPAVARSEVSIFQRVKEAILPKRGTIYQRSPQQQAA